MILLYIEFQPIWRFNFEALVFASCWNRRVDFRNQSDKSFWRVLTTHYFSFIYNELLDEILFFILIISGLIYAFTKEKIEDEMVMKLRLDSLVWTTYFNNLYLLLCYLLFYGFSFLSIAFLALISNLLIFVLRFRWVIDRYRKEFDEK